jgi:hypothetical protein
MRNTDTPQTGWRKLRRFDHGEEKAGGRAGFLSRRSPGVITACLVMAGWFVLLCGGNLDPNAAEAKLGIASSEGIGPYAQVYGRWDASLWPAQVLTSQLWAWGEGGRGSSAAIRWPSAIAAVAIGLILGRRANRILGPRAAILTALCLFSSLAMIDRSATLGVDMIAGLAILGALERLLNRGSDLAAGVWTSLAFLAGGIPPVVVILLPTIVLGRRKAALSWRLIVPLLVTFAGWSFWTMQAAPAELWAAALALPFTQKLSWTLPLFIVLAGWPWMPLTSLIASRSIRQSWTPTQRSWVVGWLQVAGVAAVAGLLIPGMAGSATIAAFGAMAIVSAAVLDRILGGNSSPQANRLFLILTFAIVLVWALLAVPLGGYLAAAVSYYRQTAVLLLVLTVGTVLLSMASIDQRRVRWAFGALVAVACMAKLVHAGIYVPERNYRLSQGPWGRAIGQWVPPNWPIYTFHTWPTDLAFATERPVRQLPDPKLLQFKPKDRPHYVLLLRAEFDHWPDSAPRIHKVRSFLDQRGDERILARTDGEVFIRKL